MSTTSSTGSTVPASAARPTVSIVLTVYNATWCVARALDSVAAQTEAPLEVLVCDDGSTDGTPDFVERRYGPPVRVLRLPHRNASATRRVGLAEAKGDWLAFMDADDWWEPNKLARQLDVIVANPGVRFISSDGTFVSEAGVIRDSWLSDYFDPVRDVIGDIFPLLVHRCFPLMSSCMTERAAYHEAGGMDPDLVYSHDYDLWMRIASRHPAALLGDRLIHYWSHPGSLSRRFEARHRDDLVLMERVARGELRDEPTVRALGARRASGLAFDIAVACLRDGRVAEARGMFARAGRAGPWPRRVLATAGRVAPGFLMRPLGRMGWLKTLVARVRTRPGTIPSAGGGE
jgi:glycosyltransferase involved in cell wall biosynthesis